MKVHHSIRSGDHSPDDLMWWVEKQSTKGWMEPRVRDGRTREPEREWEERGRKRESNSHSQKGEKSNGHETLCQAENCVSKTKTSTLWLELQLLTHRQSTTRIPKQKKKTKWQQNRAAPPLKKNLNKIKPTLHRFRDAHGYNTAWFVSWMIRDFFFPNYFENRNQQPER